MTDAVHGRRLRGSRLLVALLTCLTISVGAMGADGSGDDVAAIRRRGVLRVAVLDEFPWLRRRSGAGDPFEGAAWLIAKRAALRLRVRLVTVSVGFDDKLRVLDDGRADATIAPLLATPERRREYDLVPYSEASQCLFGMADNPKLRSVRDLDHLDRAGVTIAVVRGTPQGAWLRRRLPKASVVEVDGNITTVPTREIIERRADVATIDQYFFAEAARREVALRSLPFGTSCLDSREFTLPIALATTRHRPALASLLRRVVERDRAMIADEHRRVVASRDQPPPAVGGQ